jgi:hypothetical protein
MRMLGRTMLVIALIAATARAAAAQDPYNLSAPVPNLATIFTNIFGPNGLVVDSLATLPGEVSHSAHFNSDFQFNFGQFGTALVSQLVSVPLPSPGGGFTFEFDPSLGVFQRTTQSFGPILAERAETIGARRVSVGYAFQRFTFDSVEGISLSQVPAVFTHDNAQLLGGREDVVTTVNSITADVNQSTLFVTMGVSDKVDLSLAVPVIGVNLRVVSAAHIQRLGTTNPLTHFYRQEDGEVGTDRFFTAIGSAAGLGDLMIRMKANAFTRPKSGLAFGVDVRLPTGDEMNLLGSGTTGVQPFAIWSGTVQDGVATRERRLPVERIERAGRESRHRPVRRLPRSGGLQRRRRRGGEPAPDGCLRRARALRDRRGAAAVGDLSRARRALHVPEHRLRARLLQRGERLDRPQGQPLRPFPDGRQRAVLARQQRAARQGHAAHRARVQLLIAP